MPPPTATDSRSASRGPRIALAQLNLWVGDLQGNASRVIDAACDARDRLDADLVVFPELTLTGYPPEDLLLRPGFHDRVAHALEQVVAEVSGIAALVGFPYCEDGRVYNACALIRDRKIVARYCKQHLPNYGVFDEKRYFVEGDSPCVIDVAGVPMGLTICEDIWVPGPAAQAAAAGAKIILNINASPFHQGKGDERERLLAERSRETGLPIVYVNLMGGQDELVFDGNSLVSSGDGRVVLRAPSFQEGSYPVEFSAGDGVEPLPGVLSPESDPVEDTYTAIVTGIRDYVHKNRFEGAVVGLSGGIDSALTLALAVDALGADAVEAMLMPSRYTAEMSIEDAVEQAECLGVRHHLVSIEPAFQAALDSLQPTFDGRAADVTEENIQARCRGLFLMALSNKKGKIVLTTGNKSEMAVGYATLYGDMAGGFAPLKDVAKTDVYRLARWRNTRQAIIPERVLERPPTAELAPGQMDQDSLPPYDTLDQLLHRYVELDQSVDEIANAGFEKEMVARVVGMIRRNEYKRRQAAPGVRITRRAFGRDRRYPITSAYDR